MGGCFSLLLCLLDCLHYVDFKLIICHWVILRDSSTWMHANLPPTGVYVRYVSCAFVVQSACEDCQKHPQLQPLHHGGTCIHLTVNAIN